MKKLKIKFYTSDKVRNIEKVIQRYGTFKISKDKELSAIKEKMQKFFDRLYLSYPDHNRLGCPILPDSLYDIENRDPNKSDLEFLQIMFDKMDLASKFDEFDDEQDITVKTMPQPILEIYKQIYNLA